jgi:hypothetical protein
MAEADEGIEDGAISDGPLSPADNALRAIRMLERLLAGLPLTEVAAREGLTPRRARELVAEAVAERGFDP